MTRRWQFFSKPTTHPDLRPKPAAGLRTLIVSWLKICCALLSLESGFSGSVLGHKHDIQLIWFNPQQTEDKK
jgi:hypothetical protein